MQQYYTKDTILYADGNFLPAKEAQTDLFGQTLHYGYGVFEGIRSYATIHGTKIFKPQAHFDRLKQSCAYLGIPLDYTTEEMTQIAYQVLTKNGLSNAYLRPLVFCSPNMSLTSPKKVSLMITAWDWGKYFANSSLRVCISSYERPNPRSIHVEAKACGNYVNSILATTEAKAKGYDEALMLDMYGHVAEAPGANFFMEKDGELVTPKAGSILPGITRGVVMEICAEMDIPIQERSIAPEELDSVDSAFFCGTAAEITALESINGQRFNKPWKKSIGRVVQEAYQNMVLEKSYSYVIV